MRRLYTGLVSNVLFPIHERLKGHETARVLRELEGTQWWSPDRLEALRSKRLRELLTPRMTPFIAHAPTARQHAALLLSEKRELLYGGAAGGGKSDFLLMAALQYVDVPGYAALIMRRTFAQLSKAGGLLERILPVIQKHQVDLPGAESLTIETAPGRLDEVTEILREAETLH